MKNLCSDVPSGPPYDLVISAILQEQKDAKE